MSGLHRDGMRGSVCAFNGAVWLIPITGGARRHRGSIMQSDATQISAHVSNEGGRGEQKQPCQRGSALSGPKIIKQTNTHTHTHTDMYCMNPCRSFHHKCKKQTRNLAFSSNKSSSDWIFSQDSSFFSPSHLRNTHWWCRRRCTRPYCLHKTLTAPN